MPKWKIRNRQSSSQYICDSLGKCLKYKKSSGTGKTYLSFSGFWRVRGFIVDQTVPVSHPGLEKKSRQHGPLGLSQAKPPWLQTPAAYWSHPAQPEPCPRNSTTFKTSCDFSLIQVPVQIRWDQSNNFNYPLNIMAKWLWYHLKTYSCSNYKFQSSTLAEIQTACSWYHVFNHGFILQYCKNLPYLT